MDHLHQAGRVQTGQVRAGQSVGTMAGAMGEAMVLPTAAMTAAARNIPKPV